MSPAATRHLVVCSPHPFCAELVSGLRSTYGSQAVWSTEEPDELGTLIRRFEITDLYWLPDLFAFDRSDDPEAAWAQASRNFRAALELARRSGARIFYPSTISVFGPSAPRLHCPNEAPQNPPGVFGLFKRAAERWCEQYFLEFGVDVRCLRLPVLLRPCCFSDRISPSLMIGPDQPRPAILVEDAVQAAIELMAAPGMESQSTRCYNLAGVSISLGELSDELAQCHPLNQVEMWNLPEHAGPCSLNDSAARADWGWQPRRDFIGLVDQLLQVVGCE
jgi:nucleoside-diphosphate-sugar epimerase